MLPNTFIHGMTSASRKQFPAFRLSKRDKQKCKQKTPDGLIDHSQATLRFMMGATARRKSRYNVRLSILHPAVANMCECQARDHSGQQSTRT